MFIFFEDTFIVEVSCYRIEDLDCLLCWVVNGSQAVARSVPIVSTEPLFYESLSFCPSLHSTSYLVLYYHITLW